MEALFQLGLFLLLLVSGFIFGRRAEHKHYQSIFQREEALRHLFVLSGRLPPADMLQHDAHLVTGSVVISVDYFKTFTAGLRNLIGGHISAYESLLDRARREAILRMQAEAEALGAEAIINMKFETSRIAGNAGQGLGSIEVLAYGTALVPGAQL